MIAIIDDDADLRGATTDLLKSLGYDAVEFESAEQFLDAAHGPPMACLILDQNLPGMQGLELQAHLRETDATVAIIIVTGYPNPEDRDRALNGGAVAYLAKPWDRTALIDAIGTALRVR